MIYNQLKQDPYFRLGLLIKVLAILFFIPSIQETWFVPFLVNFIQNPSINPWASFVEINADTLSFPYGVPMLLAHLPTTALGWITDGIFGTNYFTGLGFRVSLLIADIACLFTLCELKNKHYKTLVKLYWLSPVVFLIIYWHGQTDIIPVSLLFLGAVFAFKGKLKKSAFILATALVSKHSAAIAIPFLLLYLLVNKRGSKKSIIEFFLIFSLTALILEGGFIFYKPYLEMVFLNPEVNKLFWHSLEMGSGLSIPITPVIFSSFLYLIWRLKRTNNHLIIMAIGVGTNIVLLTIPSQPGWFLWLVPILAVYAATNKKNSNILTWLWAASFSLYHFIYSDGSRIIGIKLLSKFTDFPIFLQIEFQTFLFTLNYTLLLLLTIQLIRDGIIANDYFKLSQRALSIGISGDSGSGKSTMSQMLADVFGYNSVAKISGDDYHKWERSSPLWKNFTHLNPDANFIFKMENDVAKLIKYKSVLAQNYDHVSGHFTKLENVKNKEILLVEGLHSLYSKSLCSLLDVTIYLDMDEDLKKNFKIKRDTKKRDQSINKVLAKIQMREPNYKKYIVPQAENAGLIFKLIPLTIINNYDETILRYKLQVIIKNGMYCERLSPCLISLTDLQVDEKILDKGWVHLEIEGDVFADDIAFLVETLVPEMNTLICHSPKYRDGMEGIMQLITLIEIDNHFKQRI